MSDLDLERRNRQALSRAEARWLTPPEEPEPDCGDGECGDCARCIEARRREAEEARAERLYEESLERRR